MIFASFIEIWQLIFHICPCIMNLSTQGHSPTNLFYKENSQ